ncbi:hypothetical protein EYF80_006823 [Liparis tanakae]|uniref:Uncharacterized protein n=1 Tax=Liparis tanakae TaxID=230148 RepID=A0A4Z2IYA8_9TELE|nr:hypothetical protein EYF80_006823 [Liparis tanakae]
MERPSPIFVGSAVGWRSLDMIPEDRGQWTRRRERKAERIELLSLQPLLLREAPASSECRMEASGFPQRGRGGRKPGASGTDAEVKQATSSSNRSSSRGGKRLRSIATAELRAHGF